MIWKMRLLGLGVLLFLACNVVLVFSSDKIGRTYYVDDWTAVKKQDLLETMPAEGVLAPKEEQHVYYDSATGKFNGFKVEKGDKVQPGDAIYEFSPEDITSAKEAYQIEKEKLENELVSIEKNINDLEIMRRSLAAVPSEENDQNSDKYMAQLIQKDILEKEMQKDTLESEIGKYEDLIGAAEESLLNLEAVSEIAGTVKSINHDLSNPVATIVSNEHIAEGVFSEEEVKKASEGMRVLITNVNTGKKVSGTIEKVLTYPESKPSPKKESRYAFRAVLDGEPENQSIHGEHVAMKIILNEIKGTLTVPSKAVRKSNKGSFSYMIRQDGNLEKRKVKSGITIAKTQEIKDGASAGELVLLERPPFLKSGYPFITPIEISRINKKDFKSAGKKNMLKISVRGIVAN
ncbi:efflux RND transporter periplasmic adaptor subunit [Cytobacillus firmus]|uniref:efflux RND transporter periplasmic adaptor subunit n=1 Tax=Cytobacillus firmus TaxID=1399 RepID=UPI002184BFE7|nr:efflux RND transporter periplasmic adaptor subunit [Cytobacillus firmus]URM33389.1 efflux RND transporter periplasmic adaptor subunit [Cytobacillus firmus]